MSVEALLTNQRNNARYNVQTKSPLKSKDQELSWGTDFAPGLFAFDKEEYINKNITKRLDKPALNSCYIPPIVKTRGEILVA